jgi:hypothetical protein
MRTQAAMLVSAALFLVAAPSAGAVTGGFGVAKALRLTTATMPVIPKRLATKDKRDSCESSGVKLPGTAKAGSSGKNFDRRFAPVACEQPTIPNMKASDSLQQATKHALAILGWRPAAGQAFVASAT